MPALTAETTQDISNEGDGLIREFVVLPNEGVMLNGDRRRFAYFESVHSDLKTQITTLEELGYIRDVSTTNAPVDRMTEDFAFRLRTDSRNETA